MLRALSSVRRSCLASAQKFACGYVPVVTPAKPVIEQYDNEQSRQFYQLIMGDGGYDIHYGLFDEQHTTTKAASANTILTLYRMLTDGAPLTGSSKILDLGSGHGGASHTLAQWTTGGVTCYNLCPQQNRMNAARVKELGLERQITILEGSFEELPADWSRRYDAVWSQDAFCHSDAKPLVLAEAFRVLRPGGRFAFSDIMAGENATDVGLEPFKRRLHVNELYKLSQYVAALKAVGFRVLGTQDWSHQLARNYAAMADRCEQLGTQLTHCDPEWLKTYIRLLRDNVTTAGDQAWCAIVAERPK